MACRNVRALKQSDIDVDDPRIQNGADSGEGADGWIAPRLAVRHRGVEPIDAQYLLEVIGRTPRDHYVVWTGHVCTSQEGSLRARAMSCISESCVPVPLRVLLQRVARLEPNGGLDPEAVRSAFRMHQSARPAAYLLVRQLTSRAFVAVADIAAPAGRSQPIAAGDLIIDGRGQPQFTPHRAQRPSIMAAE